MVEKEDVTQVGSDFGFRPSFGLRISANWHLVAHKHFVSCWQRLPPVIAPVAARRL
jgi:hypothetical protein